MYRMLQVAVITLVITFITASSWANSTPQVSNVVAAQRGDDSKLVDIYYDLADADGDACTVWAAVKNTAEADWRIPILSVVGAVGSGISPGTNKHIVWDAGADIPGWQGNFKVRVYADDGNSDDSLVLIPGGEFEMGDHYNAGGTDEVPKHDVYLDAFLMSRYEVTNQQYCTYLNNARSQGQIEVRADNVVYAVGDNDPYLTTYEGSSYSRISYNGSVFTILPDMENHPVVMVSWYGAVAFANWKSQQQGYQTCYNLTTWVCDLTKNGFRMPTEAEWEYAARGGHHNPYYKYPWGSNSISCSYLNYRNGTIYCNPLGLSAYPYTATVGYYSPNNFGLYDISGNVWEWCNDWYASDYYGSSPYTNPPGPTSGSYRVVRGGAWNFSATYCRVAERSGHAPSHRYDYNGFRLVLDLE